MKSSINQEVFKEWALKAESTDKQKLVDTALAYGMAIVSKNGQLIETAYKVTVECVLQMEEKYQVKFLESPDGKYRKAMLLLASVASKVKEKNKQAQNQVHKVFFQNMKEANNWLLNNKVDVASMELETGTGLGLMANHTTIKEITLYYRKNDKTKYQYHLCEEEEIGVFIKRDKDKVAQKWKERNPGVEIVTQKIFTNSRGEAVSLVIGFGQYWENIKIITLCRELSVRERAVAAYN